MLLYISKKIFQLFSGILSFIGTVLIFVLPIVTIFVIIQAIEEKNIVYLFIPFIIYFFAKSLMDISKVIDDINHQ